MEHNLGLFPFAVFMQSIEVAMRQTIRIFLTFLKQIVERNYVVHYFNLYKTKKLLYPML